MGGHTNTRHFLLKAKESLLHLGQAIHLLELAIDQDRIDAEDEAKRDDENRVKPCSCRKPDNED